MIVTLRTLPRDDGGTSVILTRDPSDPRDPEVVNVFGSSRKAVEWMLNTTCRIVAEAEDRCLGYESRYRVRAAGECTGFVRLTLELADGEELQVRA